MKIGSVSQACDILGRLKHRTDVIYTHLRINQKYRTEGISLIISPPMTSPSSTYRGGIYAEYHYEEVAAVLRGERERVSQDARTVSVQPDGLDPEAAICHEFMHDILYAFFGSSERNEFYRVVKEALETNYLQIARDEFWQRLRDIPANKEFLTGFFHVNVPDCNPLSVDLQESHAAAAELFAHLGMEFLGYPACKVTGGSWLIGEIPPQLIAYFRKTNLSDLDNENWQRAIDLRIGLKNTRDKQEKQQLEAAFNAFYQRKELADAA